MARYLGIFLIGLTAMAAIADDAPPRKPGAYGTPATAKPLPPDPYAGDRGLSVEQLANPPAPFERNPRLPSSVPQPVLPTALNNMPLVPPFVSPAFEPRTTPAPGNIQPQPRR